jgi:hypothetical protein
MASGASLARPTSRVSRPERPSRRSAVDSRVLGERQRRLAVASAASITPRYLHHTALDRYVLGIRPDLTVELSVGLLRDHDGPMLQHGLRGFHGRRITVPHAEYLKPNPDFLAERYELFRRVG